MIDLSLCEYKYPVSPLVTSRVKNAVEKINKYPRYKELYSVLEDYTGYESKHILVGSGLNEVITLLSEDILNKNNKVVVLKPDFPMYEIQALRNHCSVERVNCFDKSFEIDVDEVLQACRGAKMLWISNPNNPTGEPIPEKKLIKIIENSGCIVCIDECYYNYYGKTVLPLVKKYNNLIVLRSFSKTHGLAGLRFGYAIANPRLIKKTKKHFKFEVNRLAVEAAIAAIRDEPYYEEVWKKLAKEREFVKKNLERMGFEVLPSRTTFLCVKVGDGEKTKKWLERNNICLKVAYDMPEWVRVGIGTREMNDKFISVMRKFSDINKMRTAKI